jgi:type I restriction enzyme S subunit
LYKESELGSIPNEWEVMKLEELTNYVDYRGKTPPKTDKGIFLITAKNIKQGYIDYENSQEYIPVFAYKAAMSRGIPELGDVLITTEAPMGNVAQINIEGFALAQRVIKYRCIQSEMYNDFLKHSMMSEYFQKELEAESTGSTVKGIKGSRLHQLNLFKPDLMEQEKIIKSLAPFELKIQAEQSALSKYHQLKKGLMQDLLSGKVEVKI